MITDAIAGPLGCERLEPMMLLLALVVFQAISATNRIFLFAVMSMSRAADATKAPPRELRVTS